MPNEFVTVVLVATLFLMLSMGVAILLMITVHHRRARHRTELAEMKLLHVEELRKVEREVLRETLTEVGTELHDNIGQLLTAARIGISDLLRTAPGDPRLTSVKETLGTTIQEVRRVSTTLNAELWNERSLAHAVEQACERVRRLGGVDVQLVTEDHEPSLDSDHRMILFRLFQEALNNALKHAQATRIQVDLFDSGRARLCLRDNGTGFHPAAIQRGQGGQGLRNMHRRAELIGYRCTVVSAPGAGTSVILEPR